MIFLIKTGRKVIRMKSVVSKFDNIIMTEDQQKSINHYDMHMNDEDYKYCKNIESLYFKAYDLQVKILSSMNELIQNNSTQDELDKWKENEFNQPIIAAFCDTEIETRKIKYMNNFFISRILSYFTSKYQDKILKDANKHLPDITFIGLKYDDKITLNDVLNYINKKHNYQPPQD